MTNLTTPTDAHVTALKNELPADEHEFLIPETVGPIANYALEVTHSHTPQSAYDGEYWEGYLYRFGHKVMQVGNRGDGGPNYYYNVNADHTEVHAFMQAARAAFPAVKYEAEGSAVAFLDLVAQLGTVC